ncbi:MAG TPA: ABC transporter permease [Mycobacteriales bacterium]|nr:ABC transporter permease [Mycobacteriales bacterium]
MSLRATLATAHRILLQLRNDPRTVGLMLLVPALLMILLRYMIGSVAAFNRIAPALLGLFPFLVMFLVTSVAMLRERTSATLERLLTTPMGKFDLLAGYEIAFASVAIVQVGLVSAISLAWLGMAVAGSLGILLLIAVLDALLGVALGLFVSAFARTEFQAVQFLPVVVLPQWLLCGLFVPRDQMAPALEWISRAMPLTYAVQALDRVASEPSPDRLIVRDIVVIVACVVSALALGAGTLQRRS